MWMLQQFIIFLQIPNANSFLEIFFQMFCLSVTDYFGPSLWLLHISHWGILIAVTVAVIIRTNVPYFPLCQILISQLLLQSQFWSYFPGISIWKSVSSPAPFL